MQILIQLNGRKYTADMANPLEIAIPLDQEYENQPNAYGAPPFTAEPFTEGDFVASLEAGAPVNSFNLAINPHGNGTHTECAGHILPGEFSLRKTLQNALMTAELITVTPEEVKDGMHITESAVRNAVRCDHTEALIVRTLPNPESKKHRKYTGTNPPWFSREAMQWIADHGYMHLLTDLPSVDPEVDGGALDAHRTFWNTDGVVRSHSTITEMIYVPNNVEDGLFLLNLQTLALGIDASPSRPVLYALKEDV